MRWTAGLELAPDLKSTYIMFWAFMYFGIVLFLGWLPMHNKREGQATVQTIVIGVQAFCALIALGDDYDGRRVEALMFPVLYSLIVVGVFWYMRKVDRERQNDVIP